jgi:hypothetical protein
MAYCLPAITLEPRLGNCLEMQNASCKGDLNMNHWIRHTFALIAALMLLSFCSAPLYAQSYAFAQIVDSSAGYDPFEFGCPAINNKGDVAFRAMRDSGADVISVAKNKS